MIMPVCWVIKHFVLFKTDLKWNLLFLNITISTSVDILAAVQELEQLRVNVVETSTQTEMVGTDMDDLENAMTAKDEEV